LRREFSFGGKDHRIGIIQATANPLKRATAYLVNKGIDLSELGMDLLVCSGNYLSETMRKWLESSWGCPVSTVYGLSEVRGSTASESGYGVYLMPPYVIPELVDPFTFQKQETGVGLLLLSTLYPIAQQTLLIRYSTGDLMERVDRGDRYEPAYRFKGRTSHSLIRQRKGKTQYLVLAADLVDFLDAEEHVIRSTEDSMIVFKHFEGIGYNRVQLEYKDNDRFGIVITVSVAPEMDRGCRRSFAERLKLHLVSCSDDLRDSLKDGSVSLEIVFSRKGELAECFPA